MADRTPLRNVLGVLGWGLLIAVLVAIIFPRVVLQGRGGPRLETALRFKLFLTTFNVVLLFVLAKGYVSIYRDLPNPFTRSLVLFTVAMLFYALAANPAVHIILGYPQAGLGTLLGPFAYLSDMFAAIAIVALLYQSYK